MNREDIIRMARKKANAILLDLIGKPEWDKGCTEQHLIEFSALVASAEREFYMQLFLDPENQPTQFGTATQEYREQEVREAKRQERDEFKEHALAMARAAIIGAVKNEREACHALRQTLPNPHEHCQVSAHAYDMAIAAYGSAIRARGDKHDPK